MITTLGVLAIWYVAAHQLWLASESAPKRCPLCKQTGGPYPNGDRPKSSNPLRSGCPRCGWCY